MSGIYGVFQDAKKDLEVPNGLDEHFKPLLEYEEMFFAELPVLEHRGRVFQVKTRKERGIDEFISYVKDQLGNGMSFYLYNILWQPPFEVLGEKVDGHFISRFAVFNWKNEEEE